MLYAILIALSLASAATATSPLLRRDGLDSKSSGLKLSRRNNNHNNHNKQCDDHHKKPYVSSEILVAQMYESDLEDGAYILQGIADRYNGTRAVGTKGHDATLKYIHNSLSKTGAFDLYKQEVQAWVHTFLGRPTININGKQPTNILDPEFAPSGSPSGKVIYAGLGCDATTIPAAVSGQIALIDRGECDFGLKVALASSAGAVGVLLINNDLEHPDETFDATLGEPTRPEGSYVPTIFVSYNFGQSIKTGASGTFTVDGISKYITSHNLIAETRSGDHNNVITLGAHTDSVPEGPGINDNGSGVISILRVAEKLAMYSVKNAVRFCFWTAEELGLIGSTYYVEHLTESELKKIRLNLNFDMLASPNYVYAIYDGDGDQFGLSGPSGSAQIEKVFEDFYDANGKAWTGTAFDGRSDYGPFLQVNIPAGGIFSGAEENKTKAEAAQFGGVAGAPLDACYHQACDDVNNVNYDAWLLNSKAIAHSIGKYAASLDGFPANQAMAPQPSKKRDLETERAARDSRRARKLGRLLQ